MNYEVRIMNKNIKTIEVICNQSSKHILNSMTDDF